MTDGAPKKGHPARTETAVGLLALGAGAMDALSFVALGQVFTSAMTGNAVLLGVAIGQGRSAAAARSLAALLGFVAGVAIASRPLLRVPRGTWSRGTALGFTIEAGLLALFVLLLIAMGRAGNVLPFVLIPLAAGGMGAQSVLARHFNLPGIITTVFTGTLVDIVSTLAGLDSRPGETGLIPYRTAREIAAFALYTTGAAVGGGLTLLGAWVAALVPLAAVLGTLAIRPAYQS
ncbi:MAG TPA: YoaK family protein [Acetobacteraceae bacterium]|nr:YoaK family protein [Acetobacteraceae bacterium]